MCTLHGKNCVPYAVDWIREKINQTVINPNNKKSKTGSKSVAEKKPYRGDVQCIAETYKIPMDVIRKIMRDKGKNGSYAKSSKIIYSTLCEFGYAVQKN
jgi:hypothetical protein